MRHRTCLCAEPWTGWAFPPPPSIGGHARYGALGEGGRADRTSAPGRVWNRIPDAVRQQLIELALEAPDLSPRELAVTFTDTKGYFVSEASIYRLLKAHEKLCTTMRAEDVTDTLTLALEASGCDQVDVAHRPRLLSDNGASYIAGDLAEWLEDKGMDHVRGAPPDPGQDRVLAPDPEEPHPAGKLFPARRPGSQNPGFRRPLQPPTIP